MPSNSTKLIIEIYKNRDDAADIIPGMITMINNNIKPSSPFANINKHLDSNCYIYWANIGSDRQVGFNSIEKLAEILFNNSDLIIKANKNMEN